MRQQSGLFNRPGMERSGHCIRIGEKGCADWRAERPIIPAGKRVSSCAAFPCEVMYLEFKAPGKKPKREQILWLERRQLTGIAAGWFDALHYFLPWYYRRFADRAGDKPLSPDPMEGL